ncbi:MAG: cytochrome c oxidase accessory protein CcoG [Burkholderiaceae bacterium]
MVQPTRKIIPIAPALPPDEGDDLVSLYEARQKIYPRSVTGWFHTWRWLLVWATQLVFYGLPWLTWNDRPAVLFDLEARRFYIFNLVLYPQDFIYLTGLLIISALSLFLFTAVAGRLWCGYACPQTVYTEIFMWVEQKIEGDRLARQRLDASGWNLDKVWRKASKHFVWIVIGLWTGFTFVGYFTPIRHLASEVATLSLGPWETFWVLFYGFATYGNAGWMREQVCKYMCPYARFQSAMFDKDTLIIAYDERRGEPRGSRGRRVDHKAQGLGDCIDCGLCVHVCPTGIDIRQGLQYECIGCAACIDVCNTVMDKMQYPRGLIRYGTQREMSQQQADKGLLRHVLRPRVMIYGGILVAVSAALLASLVMRSDFKVNVVRDRAVIARIVAPGDVENVYRLQVMNAAEEVRRFSIDVSGLTGIKIVSEQQLELGAAQSKWATVRVTVPVGAAPPGSQPIAFNIRSIDESESEVTEKSVFVVPR